MSETLETPAAWAARLADELVDMPHVPMPEAGSSRVDRERRDAADRQRRSRDKRRRRAELDGAVASAVGMLLRKGNAYERIRADGFGTMGIRVEWMMNEAVRVLVEDCSWPKAAAVRALNVRLLRP